MVKSSVPENSSAPITAEPTTAGPVRTTRRGLLGLSGAAVLAAIASETVTPASAANAASAPPKMPASPPKVRAIASRPFAHGGPISRDQSMATTVATGAADLPVGAQYKTFSAAAAASVPLASTLFNSSDHKAHLLRRATFGARAQDVADLKRLGIDGWLKRQLAPSSIVDTGGIAAWASFPLAGASPATIIKHTKQYSWDAMFETAQATLARQIFSSRQLYEVVVDIMTNHLHVAVPSEQWHTSPDFIKNVIRKYTFGTYTSMLLAAMKHPAMLEYLNNDESYKEHVNENLGRELLELHTVGIAGGYTENDVKASAAILSGRTLNYDKGTYLYNGDQHVTGPVTVLGFTSANLTEAGGQAVGDAYIRYLATHRSTARNIARKIATRFVSDEPSANLIERLADVYLANGTSILAVVKAVFLSSDFWSAVGIRMRRPLEDTVGAARVLGVGRASTSKYTKKGVINLYWNLWDQTQAPLGWDPPNGYPDVAAAWLGAGSMIQRWNTHRVLVHGWWGSLKYIKPLALVPSGKGVTAATWLNALFIRLVGTPPTPEHLAAILTAGGLAPTDPVPYDYLAGELASLILDSAYFQLR